MNPDDLSVVALAEHLFVRAIDDLAVTAGQRDFPLKLLFLQPGPHALDVGPAVSSHYTGIGTSTLATSCMFECVIGASAVYQLDADVIDPHGYRSSASSLSAVGSLIPFAAFDWSKDRIHYVLRSEFSGDALAALELHCAKLKLSPHRVRQEPYSFASVAGISFGDSEQSVYRLFGEPEEAHSSPINLGYFYGDFSIGLNECRRVNSVLIYGREALAQVLRSGNYTENLDILAVRRPQIERLLGPTTAADTEKLTFSHRVSERLTARIELAADPEMTYLKVDWQNLEPPAGSSTSQNA